MDNPDSGILEADQLHHARVLQVTESYLGDIIVGVYSDGTPLQDRERIFPEDIDQSCPWQFGNFRVVWLSIIYAMSD
jgi:homospermidine synthase